MKVRKTLQNLYRAYFISKSPLIKGRNGYYIFIHINKTAGTSISTALDFSIKQHFTAKEIIDLIGEDKWRRAFKFTFVRNPFSKVISHYHYRIETNQTQMKSKKIDFKTWLKKTYGEEKDPFYYDNPKMFLPQCEWLKNHNDLIDIDFIGKFENLENDFREVQSKLGLNKKLPAMNKTKRDHYKNYHDQETIEIINNWFFEDLERFDYRF